MRLHRTAYEVVVHRGRSVMSTFTYHSKSKAISCVCGNEISGQHTCEGISKVEECTNKDCLICELKEKERLFEDQWRVDEDGYSRCSTCGDHSDCELPKHCNCTAYVDVDGIEKCKSCNDPWGGKETEFDDCNKCGYQGE